MLNWWSSRLEGVFQHEALHLAVVLAAPIATTEEGPANFDHPLGSVEAMVPRGSDQLSGRTLDGNQRATRIQGVSQELSEDGFLVTVRGRNRGRRRHSQPRADRGRARLCRRRHPARAGHFANLDQTETMGLGHHIMAG